MGADGPFSLTIQSAHMESSLIVLVCFGILLSHIALDFVATLPLSQGNTVVLLLAVSLVALPKHLTDCETADHLVHHVCHLYGILP